MREEESLSHRGDERSRPLRVMARVEERERSDLVLRAGRQ